MQIQKFQPFPLDKNRYFPQGVGSPKGTQTQSDCRTLAGVCERRQLELTALTQGVFTNASSY